MSWKIHKENKTKLNRDKPPGNPVSLVFKTSKGRRLIRNTQLDRVSFGQTLMRIKPHPEALTKAQLKMRTKRHWDTTVKTMSENHALSTHMRGTVSSIGSSSEATPILHKFLLLAIENVPKFP